jgi:hypothetical protein
VLFGLYDDDNFVEQFEVGLVFESDFDIALNYQYSGDKLVVHFVLFVVDKYIVDLLVVEYFVDIP